jgi:Na+/melibiose symporter-like transporter
MLATLFGIDSTTLLGSISALAAITSVIVEILKKILPDKVPTQIVTLIVGIIVSLVCVILFSGISVSSIVLGILEGFGVSYASMYGYDTLKDIIDKFGGDE